MSQLSKTLFVTILCALSLVVGAPAQEEQESPTSPFPPAAESLTGDWKVMLENDNGRKQITFRVEEKNERLRGKVASKEYGTLDLDGRRDGDNKVLFWCTWYDRGGVSIESSFKGVLEGEAIVGESRYFNKPYRFRAERVVRKDKSK